MVRLQNNYRGRVQFMMQQWRDFNKGSESAQQVSI
jgi:hypothetical protein